MLCPSNTLGPALLRRPAGLFTSAKTGSASRSCLGRRYCSGGGVRCSTAPDGSKPRLPSTTPSKEEIKQAILGYSAQEGAAGNALQAAASSQQAAGQHASASALALAQQQQGEVATAIESGSWEDWKQFIDGLDMTVRVFLVLVLLLFCFLLLA